PAGPIARRSAAACPPAPTVQSMTASSPGDGTAYRTTASARTGTCGSSTPPPSSRPEQAHRDRTETDARAHARDHQDDQQQAFAKLFDRLEAVFRGATSLGRCLFHSAPPQKLRTADPGWTRR